MSDVFLVLGGLYGIAVLWGLWLDYPVGTPVALVVVAVILLVLNVRHRKYLR